MGSGVWGRLRVGGPTAHAGGKWRRLGACGEAPSQRPRRSAERWEGPALGGDVLGGQWAGAARGRGPLAPGKPLAPGEAEAREGPCRAEGRPQVEQSARGTVIPPKPCVCLSAAALLLRPHLPPVFVFKPNGLRQCLMFLNACVCGEFLSVTKNLEMFFSFVFFRYDQMKMNLKTTGIFWVSCPTPRDSTLPSPDPKPC